MDVTGVIQQRLRNSESCDAHRANSMNTRPKENNMDSVFVVKWRIIKLLFWQTQFKSASFFRLTQNQEVFDFYGRKRGPCAGISREQGDFSVNEMEIDILSLRNEIGRLRRGKATDSKEACI